jgi:hypothetical protein
MRRMPFGYCRGCGQLGPLPPFGEQMCFLCATDGPPGETSRTGGAMAEGETRADPTADWWDPSDRQIEIAELFVEAQCAASTKATLANPFERTDGRFIFFRRSTGRFRHGYLVGRNVRQLGTRRYQAIMRQEHRSDGLCIKMCNRPAEPGKSRCAQCAAYNRGIVDARHARLAIAGLCKFCGKNPATRSRCEPCLARRRAQRVAHSADRAAE